MKGSHQLDGKRVGLRGEGRGVGNTVGKGGMVKKMKV